MGYPTAGGYEEYTQGDFHSPGWSEAYTGEIVAPAGNAAADTIRLHATLPSGLRIDRTLRLQDSTLRIETVATNGGAVPVAVTLRSHPEFSAPADLGPRVSWRDRSGSDVEAVLVPDEKDVFLKGQSMPAGEWTLRVGDSRITERFEPAQVASVLLNGTLAAGRVNLELYGLPQNLAHGQSTRLDQTWVIQDAAPAPTVAP